MSGKYALIIGNTQYNDLGLAQLAAPGKDVEDFARVLKDQEIGAFDQVDILLNHSSSSIIEAIDEFFDQRKSDDLLVLYFSGHGLRDDIGMLYLAAHNTIRSRLRSTAVKSDYIREAMDQSRSKRQVLILDCCNSGAFAQGTKAAIGASMGTASAFEGTGYGRVVLTASDATQYAWEGDKVIGETGNSLFTNFLIKGLENDADKDHDGRITVDDLFDYVYEQIVSRTTKQTPGKWTYKQQGEILLRELTETQKEQLRLLELEEQRRKAQEEVDRLLRAQAEREDAEKYKAQLNAEKAAAQEAIEKLNQERLKLEAIKLEIERQKEGTNTITQTHKAISSENNNKRSLFPNRYIIIFSGLIIFAILSFGMYAIINNGTLFPSAITTAKSSAEPSENSPFESEPVKLNSPAEKLDFTAEATPMALADMPPPLSSTKIDMQSADQVVQLARWGKGVINQATYSPDGKNIALATSIGIYILDGANLNEIRFIDTNYFIQGAIFSSDGETIIAITSSGDILKFRTSDGAFISGWKGNYTYVRTFSFLKGKDILAIVGYTTGAIDTTEIFLQNLEDGSILKRLTPDAATSPSVEKISFSPDGQFLISYTQTGIYLWNPQNGKLIKTMESLGSYSSDIVFSPDSKMFAYSNSRDGSIFVVNAIDGTLLQTLEGHGVGIGALSFSPDGQSLFYGIGKGAIRVRRISDGNLVKTLQGHTDWVNTLMFSPEGKSLITTSDDKTISVWDLDSSTISHSTRNFSTAIRNISVSPDNKFLASSSEPGQLWQVTTGSVMLTLQDINDWNGYVGFLPISQNLAVSTNNGLIIRKFEEGNLVKVAETYIYPNRVLAFSPNEQFIAADTYENSIEIHTNNFTPGFPSKLFDLKGHTDEISSLAFSPNNKILASGSHDSTIRLWNIEDGSVKQVLSNHLDWVNNVTFSPDGKILASGSDDGTIIFWKVENGAVERTIELPPKQSATSLTFSPDGQIIASGSYDGSIRLWSTNNGGLLQTLEGNTDNITGLIFTSDGQNLISSSDDGTIRFWGINP